MREYLVRTVKEALILLLILMLFPNNEIAMKHFIAAILLCSFVAVLTNPSPKLATADSGDNTGRAQSDMINQLPQRRTLQKDGTASLGNKTRDPGNERKAMELSWKR